MSDGDQRSEQLRRAIVPAICGLLALVLVVVGYVIGWRLAGEYETETRIGRVAFEVRPTLDGGATAVIPVADWGLRAEAYTAPFELAAELRTLDRPNLIRAANGDTTVLADTETELQAAARRAIVRAFAWGTVVALILIAIAVALARFAGRRTRAWLAGFGAAWIVVLGGGSLLVARTTFDATAFDHPTYFARGAELGRILEIADETRVSSDYGTDFGNVLQAISTILALPSAGLPGGGPTLYAGSDLHANALVIRPISQAVGQSAVLLAGDFGQRGVGAEARLLAPRVAALGSRVVATSGNHDSAELMRELAADGVTVLEAEGRLEPDGAVVPPPLTDVDGLAVAGFADPLEWSGSGDPADRPITFEDLPDPEAAFTEALNELIADYDGLPSTPDVAMVHQNALAQGLADALSSRPDPQPLVIVTGHDHAQHINRYGPITLVDGGSIGAGGIFDAGSEPIGLARLNFLSSGLLGSVDLISIEPFSGAAQASRVVIASMCPDEDRCSYEPPDPGAVSSGTEEAGIPTEPTTTLPTTTATTP